MFLLILLIANFIQMGHVRGVMTSYRF